MISNTRTMRVGFIFYDSTSKYLTSSRILSCQHVLSWHAGSLDARVGMTGQMESPNICLNYS